jgi:hypothetical protein
MSVEDGFAIPGFEDLSYEEKLAKVIEKNLEVANKYIKLAPAEFFLRICHGLSDYPLPEDQHLFGVNNSKPFANYYRDIANIYIESNRLPLLPTNKETYSIRDFLRFSNCFGAPSLMSPFSSGSGDVIAHETMSYADSSMHTAFFELCYQVIKGVPIYRIDKETRKPIERLNDSHEIPIFLKMKCKYDETFKTGGRWPEWFDTHGLMTSHIEAADDFFSKINDSCYDDLIPFVPIFRKQIGINEDREARAEDAPNELMGYVAKVQKRYYGDNFDINTPSTWTPSTTIVAWLQSEGLSQRQANAVDIVARPDLLRRNK